MSDPGPGPGVVPSASKETAASSSESVISGLESQLPTMSDWVSPPGPCQIGKGLVIY